MSTPLIARGDLRHCLADLIEQCQARGLADPQRAERWGRLERRLTLRLASQILREAGRPVYSRKDKRK